MTLSLSHPSPSSRTPSFETNGYVYSESDFDGYRAAPLVSIDSPVRARLIASQDGLAQNLETLVYSEVPKYAKQSGVDFVAQSILRRMQQREGLNSVSYLSRKNNTPDFSSIEGVSPEEIADACEKMIYGSGTVLQNELARIAYGMSAAEYANLTIIGEARKQLEPAMWDEVSELAGKDATPQFDDFYRFTSHGFDKNIVEDVNVSALRFGMKRRIGSTPHGADIKARTTAIFKLHPTYRAMGFSGTEIRDIISEFQEVERQLATKSSATHEAYDDIAKERKTTIADLPAFQLAVEWLVSTEVEPGLVLARNETVYGAVPGSTQ